MVCAMSTTRSDNSVGGKQPPPLSLLLNSWIIGLLGSWALGILGLGNGNEYGMEMEEMTMTAII